MSTTKSRYYGGVTEFIDSDSHERLARFASLQYREDFLGVGSLVIPAAGASENGCDWVKKIVGAAPPTVAGIASAPGGVMRNALTATSEKQDAAFYQGDQLCFDLTKGFIIETRTRLHVLPSAAGVQCVWGMSSAWIDGPDNASFYAEFGCTANGVVLMRSQDGVTQNSVSSGITVVADDWHIYRIEALDPTDMKFFIDGGQVSSTGAIAFAATGANAVLQPYVAAYKPSGVGVATVDTDYVKIWANRS